MEGASNDHGEHSIETDGGRRQGRTGVDQSSQGTGLDRNVAGALAYVLFFVSGIVLYVLEDDEFVQYHAAQSVVVFGALAVANVVVGSLFVVLGSVAALLNGLLSLVTFALWAFLIVTAYQGRRTRIPVAAGIAESLTSGTGQSGRSSSGYGGGTTRSGENTHASGSEDTDAIETLRERYARREIGEAEFERKIERLLEDEAEEETVSGIDTERFERSQ